MFETQIQGFYDAIFKVIQETKSKEAITCLEKCKVGLFKQIKERISVSAQTIRQNSIQIEHNKRKMEFKETEVNKYKLEARNKNDKIAELEADNDKLKKQLQFLRENWQNEKAKIEDLNTKFEAKLQYDKLAQQTESKKKQLRKLLEDKEKINQEIRDAIDQIKNKQQEIAKADDEIKNKCLMIKQSQRQLAQIKQQLEQFRQKKNDFLNNLELLKNEIQSMNEIKKEIINQGMYTDYDVQIKLGSLTDFEQGVQLVAKKQNTDFSIQKIVGLVGVKDTGKTFFLNKLTGQNFVHGYHQNQPGLFFKIPTAKQLKNLLFIDASGSELCVDYATYLKEINKETSITDKNQQIRLAEKLIEEYIYKFSKVIIIVVNQLSAVEQNKIYSLLLSTNPELKEKTINIVHNFKNLRTRQTVNERIQLDIIKAMSAKKHQLEIKNHTTNETQLFTYYVSNTNSGALVFHYILVEEETQLAQQMNWKTYETIRNNIRNPDSTKLFKIKQSFTGFAKSFMKSYFYYPEAINLKIQKLQNQGQNNKIDLIKYQTTPNQKIKLKKLLFTSIGKHTQYPWAYSIFKNQEKQYEVFADIPGIVQNISFEISFQIKSNCYHLLIRYTRKWEEQLSKEKILLGNRDIDPERIQKFKIIIEGNENKMELNLNQITLNSKKLLVSIGNGVYKIILPMMNAKQTKDSQFNYEYQ